MILLYYGSLAAAVIGITTIVKERSVGAKAIKDVREEIEDIKREKKTMDTRVTSVEGKYDDFVRKILNNFPFK